jgi:hypothetical protein
MKPFHRKSNAESDAQRDLDLGIAVLRHARKMKSDWQRVASILGEESTQVLSTSVRTSASQSLSCCTFPLGEGIA